MRRLSRSAELARPRPRHCSSGSRARVGLQDAHRSASAVSRVRTLLRHDFRIRFGFHGKLLQGRFSAASTRCGLTATATPRPSGLSPPHAGVTRPPASFRPLLSPRVPLLRARSSRRGSLCVRAPQDTRPSGPACAHGASSCAHALSPRAFPCGPCTSCACPSRGRGPALGAGRAVSSRHTRPCFPPSPHLKRPECVGRLRAVASGVAAPFALLGRAPVLFPAVPESAQMFPVCPPHPACLPPSTRGHLPPGRLPFTVCVSGNLGRRSRAGLGELLPEDRTLVKGRHLGPLGRTHGPMG